MNATVVAVSLSPVHAFSKQAQTSICLLAGLGVQGDAHCGATVQHVYLKRKTPLAPNRMQVHLLQSELFAQLAADHPLQPGDLGENITTAGVDLLNLPLGAQLRLGADAVVELTGLRTPCRQIDLFQPGLQRAVTNMGAPPRRRGRAGVMAVVLHGGTVAPADSIVVTLPAVSYFPLQQI